MRYLANLRCRSCSLAFQVDISRYVSDSWWKAHVEDHDGSPMIHKTPSIPMQNMPSMHRCNPWTAGYVDMVGIQQVQ